MTIITSKANSVVKNAKKLHQKKYRKSAYLIEGWHLFEEAVQAGVTIEKIFALENYRDQLASFPQTVWVSEDILLDLADSQTPQGIVAVVQKEEVGQAEKVKTCIEQLQEQEKQLSQVNRNELDL